MLKSRVRWVEGKQFVAEGGSGHAVVIDASPSVGGRDTGVTPMELLLMGTAGCTAVDVVYILGDRMHQEVRALEVTAEADRRDTEPKVFTEVRMHYVLSGRNVKPEKVEAVNRGESPVVEPGLAELEKLTGVPVLGVIPYISDLTLWPEDSLFFEEYRGAEGGELVQYQIGEDQGAADYVKPYIGVKNEDHRKKSRLEKKKPCRFRHVSPLASLSASGEKALFPRRFQKPIGPQIHKLEVIVRSGLSSDIERHDDRRRAHSSRNRSYFLVIEIVGGEKDFYLALRHEIHKLGHVFG